MRIKQTHVGEPAGMSNRRPVTTRVATLPDGSSLPDGAVELAAGDTTPDSDWTLTGLQRADGTIDPPFVVLGGGNK